MLIIDDLLLSPFKGLLWVFKEVHKVAEQEKADEAQAITRALSELYMRLETGEITEEEFVIEEERLLDQLDAIEEQNDKLAEDEDEDEDEEDLRR